MLFKKTSSVRVIDESAIAATLWLMTRYQKTRCKKIAHLVEQHLAWLSECSDSPTLAQACEKLCQEWRVASKSTHTSALPSRH